MALVICLQVDAGDNMVGSSLCSHDMQGSDLVTPVCDGPAGQHGLNGNNCGAKGGGRVVGASGEPLATMTTPMMPVPGAGIGAGVASAVAAASMAPAVQIRRQATVRRIDEVCRFLFPGLFGLFNLWYWYYYRGDDPVQENAS